MFRFWVYFEDRENKFPDRWGVGCNRKWGFKDVSTYVGVSTGKMLGGHLYLEQICVGITENSFGSTLSLSCQLGSH